MVRLNVMIQNPRHKLVPVITYVKKQINSQVFSFPFLFPLFHSPSQKKKIRGVRSMEKNPRFVKPIYY